MMTFRKLAAASAGKLIRAYFTENTPEPIHDPDLTPGKHLDPGGRLTSYYTGRDSRATWRPDMPQAVAKALGIDPSRMPRDDQLDRLFEAKRADTGEAWSSQERKISALDLTLAPHKSVTLAAEFAATPAESAAIWHAIDKANDATMRYVARELGWARKGKGGEEGADPGAVAWVSFRHHTARPTLPVQDGPGGATYLASVPTDGDPHAHIHNALFNIVVTDDGRVGSLDTKALSSIRVHEFGAYFQARLAEELRRLGARTSYDKDQQAVVLDAIPQQASDLFSKGRKQVLRSARAYAKRQGLEWDTISAEGKLKILAVTGLASRQEKHGNKNDREIWREQAEAIGWQHRTVMGEVEHPRLTDAERFDQAYRFAARHLAKEFRTAAVIDHDKLRMYAARGLIGTGIAGGPEDIDRVVTLIEERGIDLRGERVALLVGHSGEKVRVTNTAQIRIEQALGEHARRAASERAGALSAAAIKAAVDASGLDFTREPEHGRAQLAAIHAMGQGGALTVLTGVAGAGKTTLMKPLVAAWKADTRFDPAGREVVGVATAWRQADALKEAGVDRTMAMHPLLAAIRSGEFQPTRNTVLVIDEISQIGPRAMLELLELQARTGMTIKALGDREQAQAIEAGDSIELLRRAMPRSEMPELLSTVRQREREDRHIVGLFRENQDQNKSRAAEALELKRARNAESVQMLGGDHDQVVERIADFFMRRRDALAAAGSGRGITISALTNEDAADISRAVRERMRARGELGVDEVVYQAVDQRGEQYELPIAAGDRVRLFAKTWAKFDGKGGWIGSNGDIVEVVGRGEDGLTFRNKDGRVGTVEWRRLHDGETGRLKLGFGHAMTIDAAQGITSDEHINALPRGSAGITAFKAYVAESRATGTTWTIVSEAATLEAVKRGRALGDATPINAQTLWDRVGEDMAAKPYKALGIDLLRDASEGREMAIGSFIAQSHRFQSLEAEGRNLGREVRQRRQAEAVRASLPRHIAALDEALRRNLVTAGPRTAEDHLRHLRVEAEVARRRMEGVPPAPPLQPHPKPAPRPRRSTPSAGM
ncbi:ATP-dependent RecD-like DNA helicase [Roseomonas sp. TAS13]|uniref:MobF family relaxase n=1 Tax=Roseomonas TaxID=125216 RepID=UPI00096641D3|nr:MULTISPECIES: MobF family relaxase [Roseomonas]MCG7352634.1 relaxase domain-containing protein [Roseomonas mucosa]MCG7358272.1 relaxase domain-containing protein [Roseomonas mucosa]GAV34202.1 ATP-dependent RecD-like DNA helicase [Roseomonas sp. TAS13]